MSRRLPAAGYGVHLPGRCSAGSGAAERSAEVTTTGRRVRRPPPGEVLEPRGRRAGRRLLDDVADPDAIELRAGLALDAAHRLGIGSLVLADHALAVGGH